MKRQAQTRGGNAIARYSTTILSLFTTHATYDSVSLVPSPTSGRHFINAPKGGLVSLGRFLGSPAQIILANQIAAGHVSTETRARACHDSS